MSLTAMGLGSGLDINNIVNVLVEAQQLPKEALFNRSELNIDAKLSAFGQLKSALSSFQDVVNTYENGSALSTKSVSVTDENAISVDIDDAANVQPAQFDLIVDSLARADKIFSQVVADGVDLSGSVLLSKDDGSSTASITLTSSDTIYTAVEKINASSDNDFVNATVINTDAGNRVVFTAKDTGVANGINVDANIVYFNQANVTQFQSAQDASIRIDGQIKTSSTNEFSDTIQNLTITAREADASKTIKVDIADDKSVIKDNISQFVDAYNNVISSVSNLSSYNDDTNTSSVLQGDSLLRNLSAQIRSMVGKQVGVNGTNLSLYDAGISVDQYGSMSLNSSKLDTAIEEIDLSELFSQDSTGLVSQFNNIFGSYLGASGLISSRENGYQSQKIRLEAQREQFALRMESLQSRLFTQFNKMDLVVAKLNQQSQGLMDRLKSLPGLVRK